MDPSTPPEHVVGPFSCRICNGTGYEPVTAQHSGQSANLDFFRCTRCHFGFVNPNKHQTQRPLNALGWMTAADEPTRYICSACKQPALEVLGKPPSDASAVVHTHCGKCGQLAAVPFISLTRA